MVFFIVSMHYNPSLCALKQVHFRISPPRRHCRCAIKCKWHLAITVIYNRVYGLSENLLSLCCQSTDVELKNYAQDSYFMALRPVDTTDIVGKMEGQAKQEVNTAARFFFFFF